MSEGGDKLDHFLAVVRCIHFRILVDERPFFVQDEGPSLNGRPTGQIERFALDFTGNGSTLILRYIKKRSQLPLFILCSERWLNVLKKANLPYVLSGRKQI